MGLDFDWNPRKAIVNRQRHRVSFEEAATVFNDLLGASFPDPDHSEEEDRFIAVGVSVRSRLLMVSYTERHDLIWIISARELTRHERRHYENTGF